MHHADADAEQACDRPDGHPDAGRGGDGLLTVFPWDRDSEVTESCVDVGVPRGVAQSHEQSPRHPNINPRQTPVAVRLAPANAGERCQ